MMKILKATMKAVANTTTATKFRVVSRDGGDTASFSPDALNLAKGRHDVKKMTASMVRVKFGDDLVTFNKNTGEVTWNGKTMRLKGHTREWPGDPRRMPNMVFQRDGDVINVWGGYSGLTSAVYGNRYDGTSLKKVLNDLGNAAWASRDLDTTEPMLMINQNTATSIPYAGGSADDVIINIQEGASVQGGEGNDVIVNFAKNVGTLDGGTGDDAVCSVGLASGAINAASGTEDGHVRLVNNMTGGTITLGSGRNVIDASGKELNNVNIIEGAAAKSTALIAKKISGRNLSLAAEQVAVDVRTLAVNLTLGTGANSVVANTAKNVNITSRGVDAFQFGTLNGSLVRAEDSSVINLTKATKNVTFNLGSGANTINASRKVLTSVSISDKEGASTAILAKSITGKAHARSSITLSGSAEGNLVSVGGTIQHADVNTGTGAGDLYAGTIKQAFITMPGQGTFAQTVTLKSNLINSTLKGGGGTNTVTIKGRVDRSSIDLDGGENTLNIRKRVNSLTYTGGNGNDQLTVSGLVSRSHIDTGEGTNRFAAPKIRDVTVHGNTVIVIGGKKQP